MICKHCKAENAEGAKFCYKCGKTLVNSNINVMDVYPKYSFIATNLEKWKEPYMHKIFRRYFIVSALLLCYSLFSYIIYDTDVEYKTNDDWVEVIKVDKLHMLYIIDPRMDGVGYAKELSEAKREAYDGYKYGLNKVTLTLGLCSMVLFILVAYTKGEELDSEVLELKDVADYVQAYTYSGFKKPSYKFFIKDGKFGLLDVSAYKVQIPAEYDKLSWREKDKYLNATLNSENIIIDINGNILK